MSVLCGEEKKLIFDGVGGFFWFIRATLTFTSWVIRDHSLHCSQLGVVLFHIVYLALFSGVPFFLLTIVFISSLFGFTW